MDEFIWHFAGNRPILPNMYIFLHYCALLMQKFLWTPDEPKCLTSNWCSIVSSVRKSNLLNYFGVIKRMTIKKWREILLEDFRSLKRNIDIVSVLLELLLGKLIGKFDKILYFLIMKNLIQLWCPYTAFMNCLEKMVNPSDERLIQKHGFKIYLCCSLWFKNMSWYNYLLYRKIRVKINFFMNTMKFRIIIQEMT